MFWKERGCFKESVYHGIGLGWGGVGWEVTEVMAGEGVKTVRFNSSCNSCSLGQIVPVQKRKTRWLVKSEVYDCLAKCTALLGS